MNDRCTWSLECSITRCVSRTRTSSYDIPWPNLLIQLITVFDPVFLLTENGNVICFVFFLFPLFAWYSKSWPMDDTKRFVFCDTDLVFSDRILSNKHFVKGSTFVSLTKTLFVRFCHYSLQFSLASLLLLVGPSRRYC